MEYEYARKLSLTRIIAFNIWIVSATLIGLCFVDETSVEHWAVKFGFPMVILMPALIFNLSQVGVHYLVWRYKIPMQQAIVAKDLLVKDEEAQLAVKPFWSVFLAGLLVFGGVIFVFRYGLPAYQKILGSLFQDFIVPLWMVYCFYINKHFYIKKQADKEK